MTGVTLTGLLRCATLRDHTVVLLPRADAMVSGVCVIERSGDGREHVRYLSSPEPGSDADSQGVCVAAAMASYRLELLLPRLGLQNVALIVLVDSDTTDRPETGLTASTLELALKLGIGVVTVRAIGRPVAAVAAELRDVIAADLVLRAQRIAAFTGAALLDEVGLDRTVEDIRPLTDARIAVITSSAIVIAGERGVPLSFSPVESRWRVVGESASARVESIAVPHALGDEHPRFFVVAIFEHPPTPGELAGIRDLLPLAALRVARWHSRQLLEDYHSDAARSALIARLAATDGRVPPSLVAQARVLHWRLDGWHTVVGLRISGRSSDPEVGMTIRAAMSASGHRVETSRFLDHWLLWETVVSRPTREAYLSLIEAVRALRPGGAGNAVLGVARPRSGPDGFARGILEAEEFVTRAEASKGRRDIVDARDSPATRLVRNTLQAASSTGLTEPLIEELADPSFDASRETLRVFLDCESNLAETARRLGVHRNTVVNRIERVEALLGDTLDDADMRLALRIALRSATSAQGTGEY